MKYNPNVIEAKWQKIAENQTFAAANNSENQSIMC
jgi:leucyl-tRNA synthetase